MVEDEVVEIPYSVVEEEEDQIGGMEMTGTTMETIIGITTGSAPMTSNGEITTTSTANGAIIRIISPPQETSRTYRIPSQPS